MNQWEHDEDRVHPAPVAPAPQPTVTVATPTVQTAAAGAPITHKTKLQLLKEEFEKWEKEAEAIL